MPGGDRDLAIMLSQAVPRPGLPAQPKAQKYSPPAVVVGRGQSAIERRQEGEQTDDLSRPS